MNLLVVLMGPKKSKKVIERPKTLFFRNRNNKLIPQVVQLLLNRDKGIIMVPLTKGMTNELRVMIKSGDSSEHITRFLLENCLIEPQLDAHDLDRIRFSLFNNIINTILFECGFESKPQPKFRKKKSSRRIDYESYNEDLNYVAELSFCLMKGVSLESYLQLTFREVELMQAVAIQVNKAGKDASNKIAGGKGR